MHENRPSPPGLRDFHCFCRCQRPGVTVDQCCPTCSPRAACGPWRHFVWPAKAHKNFRQWGPIQCPFFVSFRNVHTGWWRWCATTGDIQSVAQLCSVQQAQWLLNPFQQIFGWDINVRDFPELSKLCKKVLTMFVSTYVCQAGFSAITNIKSKKRNSLT